MRKIKFENDKYNNIDEYEKFVGAVINDSQNRKDAIKEHLRELE